MESQPPPGNMVFCCVSKGNRILHKFNGGDRELEALAERCLEKAPALHSWYSHTVGSRTFSFLMDGNFTYFAIADPSTGNLETRWFLKRFRDSFKASKNGFQDELVPVIGRLISSLENMSRNQSSDSASADGSTNSATMLLLGKASGKHDRKKSKERVVEAEGGGDDRNGRGIKIELPHEPAGGVVSLRKSLSSRNRGPQHTQKLWCRHVKMVLAIDAVLCLVLLGVWLGICRGFQCLY
ncbi:phytolongin Phyl1.1-like [Cocos nucifera]|uniref:Phytolongin Phyl1.1-like n=1 Tax=Cocos nucifera TaxID=13894 RepID=A0A8K0MXI5_COCNU|nr:phytolongin Phyl1.1-like [Cocos nucifera]